MTGAKQKISEPKLAERAAEQPEGYLLEKTKITVKDAHKQMKNLLNEEGKSGPAIRGLSKHFHKRFSDIHHFLQRIAINKHGRGHQMFVVGHAMALGEAFQLTDDKELSEEKLVAAAVSGLMHDLGYQVSAHPEDKKLRKHDVDYHPVRSARIWAHIIGDLRFEKDLLAQEEKFNKEGTTKLDPALHDLPPDDVIKEIREWTDTWSPELKELSIRSAWHHSNGSDYDRVKVPLAAKLVRLADKLDMHNRVDWYELTPDIRKRFPNNYVHFLVPASIKNMEFEIDHENLKLIVIYKVDTVPVGELIGGYDQAEFLKDFDSAYKSGMKRAAEVAQSLFEHYNNQKMHANRDWLNVRFEFPDGESVIKKYRPEAPKEPTH